MSDTPTALLPAPVRGTPADRTITQHGPFGAKGVGEPPVVGVPAAIANAVAEATGLRFTDLPITSEAIGGALRGSRHRGRTR